MEKLVTHEVERKRDGTKVVRNYFFNEKKRNILVDAQSHFTKEEKIIAKNKYKSRNNG